MCISEESGLFAFLLAAVLTNALGRLSDFLLLCVFINVFEEEESEVGNFLPAYLKLAGTWLITIIFFLPMLQRSCRGRGMCIQRHPACFFRMSVQVGKWFHYLGLQY